MNRPDPRRKYFSYKGGGGSLKNLHYEIEKQCSLGGIFVLL